MNKNWKKKWEERRMRKVREWSGTDKPNEWREETENKLKNENIWNNEKKRERERCN